MRGVGSQGKRRGYRGVALGLIGGVVVGLMLIGGLGLTATSTHLQSAPSSGQITAINACRFAITLTATPTSGFMGQPLSYHTSVVYRSMGCALTAAHYQYYGLPFGVQAKDSPLLVGTPQVPGYFHTTVLVYVPWAAPQYASVDVVVMTPS